MLHYPLNNWTNVVNFTSREGKAYQGSFFFFVINVAKNVTKKIIQIFLFDLIQFRLAFCSVKRDRVVESEGSVFEWKTG